jgi:hypothetical protein
MSEEIEVKKTDNVRRILVVLFLILIAFGSFVIFNAPETAVLNNYQYTNGFAVFDVNKVNDVETYVHITIQDGLTEKPYILGLRYDPLSVEDIPVEGTLHTRIFDDEEVFVTIHPEAGLTSTTTIAALEIDKIIDNKNLYNIKVSSAFTIPHGDETPVKTCADATSKETVIWLTLADDTIVYTEGNCIVIAGTDEEEIVRAADRFVLTLLGVMK